MIACLDVHYGQETATAAGVIFNDWRDAEPADERVVRVSHIKPYVPGQFFLRELPCLIAVLDVLRQAEVVVIDGYVWLGKLPGLGAHLHSALGGKTAVIGVAKTKFQEADGIEILRGKSTKPLFITAAGIAPEIAAEHIRSMHGPHRIPTLLKRVDRLARDHPFAKQRPISSSYSGK